jgi:type IV secretory pathway VirJ component
VAIVTSGDGGWIHLGPDVARFLAAQGYFVVGVDAKAYLSGFTSGSQTLREADVPADYATLLDYAAHGAPAPPVLFGVSEGAGLSVLAATSPEVQRRIAGVVALGLPDKNELGWRWRDQMIYITKKTPNEPLFSVLDCVARVAPVPLAIVRSTGDEFVPAAETERIVAAAREPKKLWTLTAADHRFSDRQPELQGVLKEAIAWINQPRDASR